MPIADVLGSTLKGGAGGMSGGPMGAAIGAGVGLITGTLQEISANKAKKKAEAAMPEMVDPNQAAFLSELNTKRKSIETGADFSEGMNSIDNTTNATNAAITQNTGGDTGGTIQALLQAQSNANTGKNNIIAQGQQQQGQTNQMYAGMLDQIAARKLQLQMYRSQQNMAEWAKKKQGANANGMAGAAGLAQMLPGMLAKGAGAIGAPEGGGSDMLAGIQAGPNTALAGATGGDSANAPDLGGGGEFPELMGGGAPDLSVLPSK